ncbi:MAG: hypothetical protein ACI8T1_000261 [Verrucomicrobiales bacterium]
MRQQFESRERQLVSFGNVHPNISKMENEDKLSLIAALDQMTANAQPIVLRSENFEEFIGAPFAEIEPLITMLLVAQLKEAKRIHFNADAETRVQAVTEFLLHALYVFVSGFQRFNGHGELFMGKREGLLLEETEDLFYEVNAKIEDCHSVAEAVVRRFSPILEE